MRGEAMPGVYRVDPSEGGHLYDILGPCLTWLKKKTTPEPECDRDRCDLCGNCVYECPTKNIRINDRVVEVGRRCIVCYRCWHVCPQQAISIRFSPGKGWLERTLYSERMERRFGNIQEDEQVGPNLFREVLARRIRLKYGRSEPTAEFESSSESAG
jgi:ferredoxin